MEKICLIRQPAGLGDIIYCQKIGYHYQKLGYKIIWPIIKVFSYLPNYIYDFEYPCEEDNFPYKEIYLNKEIKEIVQDQNFIFIPLHGHNLRDRSVMKSKYLLTNLDFHDWKDYITINRNIVKEVELFNLLNPNNEKYRLINYNFGSPPYSLRMKKINFNDTIKEIELKYIENYSLFDWVTVIERAEEICMTDSAAALLVELLRSNITKRLICILRQPSTIDVKNMYTLNWKYIVGVRE